MNEPGADEQSEQRRFEQAAKTLFDDSVEGLDAETLSKLNRRRQRALAELGRPAMPGQWLRWLPATGVVAAALLTVVIVRGPAGVEPVVVPVNTAAEFEILLGEDSLEMLEELEFYAWIEDADLEPDGNAG